MKNTIKTIIIILIMTLNFHLAKAQDLPRPSPLAITSQIVGLTEIEFTYSRPGVKDRKIFGDLVDYDKIWRTGANKATSMKISTDIEIMGNILKAGTYAIFTIPGEKEWEIIFNSNIEQWGARGHKDEEDVLRIKVIPEVAENMESMLIYIDDIRDKTATINLHWEKTRITIPFSIEVESVALSNIKEAVDEADASFRVYNTAARYYLDNDQDATKALEWAEKSVSMDRRYWNLTTLSRAKAANDMKKEAIKLAEEALEMANKAKSDRYIKMNESNIVAWKAKK